MILTHNTLDLINGSFESGGAVLCAFNVLRIMRDKKVRGVSVAVSGFFALWGAWNLVYYPGLGQWLSFFGGLGLVLFNTIWVVLAVQYTRLERQRARDYCSHGASFGKRCRDCWDD